MEAVKEPGMTTQAIVYTPSIGRRRWIEGELVRRPETTVEIKRTIAEVVTSLVEQPPPPPILILDFDAISVGELMYLHTIREQGWGGAIIGLGTVPLAIRRSMSVDYVLTSPFVRDSLCQALGHAALTANTNRIPVLAEPPPAVERGAQRVATLDVIVIEVAELIDRDLLLLREQIGIDVAHRDRARRVLGLVEPYPVEGLHVA